MQSAIDTKPLVQYAPLDATSPVLLHRNACLALRSRHAECRRCEAVCPNSALQIHDASMSVRAGCLGCGRCAAACPTGALQVRGCAPDLDRAAIKHSPLRIDCARAPKGADIRVPCLGGVAVSHLLALRLAAGERALELLDHGWCTDCAAAQGSRDHPATESLRTVQEQLDHAGVPERLWPRLKAAPLPLSSAASVERLTPDLARRGAFTRFTRVLQGTAKENRSSAAPAPERAQVLTRLAQIAARHGGQVSADLFHAIEIDTDACRAHAVCAAGCPTGALRLRRVADSARELSHASALCIGCGHCERVCSEGAVRLLRGAGAPAEERVVNTFQSRFCSACGAQFALSRSAGHVSAVCERCAKRSTLARSAFAQLYARPVDGI